MERVERILALLALTVALLLGVRVLIQLNNPFFVILFALWPLLFLFLNRPQYLVIAAVWTFGSGLRLPGLPGRLEITQILSLAVVALACMRYIMLKGSRQRGNLARTLAILFGVVLVVTLAVRGTGFKALGDYKWGGMRYVTLLVTLSFFLSARTFRLTPRQCRIMVLGMCVLALIPFLSQLAYVLSGGAFYYHFYFIQPENLQALEEHERGALTRFTTGNESSQFLLLVPFVLFPYRGRYRGRYVAFILAAMIIGAVSGHRLTIIINILFLLGYGYLWSKRDRMRYIMLLPIAGVFLYAAALTLTPHLPQSFQRALSWVPLAEVAPEVALSASQTIDWRLRVWQEAVVEIPRYLLIGKGYAYDEALVYSAWQMGWEAWEWPVLQIAYHNGPLSLLIGIGVPGLLVGIGFLVAATARYAKLRSTDWAEPDLQRMYGVFFVWFIVYAFVFVFLYGDTFVSFPHIFMIAAIMELVLRSNAAIANENRL